ncbi:MAG: hypothetical protein LCH90_08460, partial [Proteobacteria bacterium]|nr:hypothetical protein [Pseudomonadota bacterium]
LHPGIPVPDHVLAELDRTTESARKGSIRATGWKAENVGHLKSRFWKLNFDRQALRCGDLRYDKKTDTIVLSSIPDELRKELLDEEDDD